MTFPMATFMPASSGGLTTFEYVTHVSSSTSGTTEIITWPSVQAGDVVVVFIHAGDTDSPDIPDDTTPSGFTKLFTETNGSTHRITASYKLCTGSESGNLTVMTGVYVTDTDAIMVQFRGNLPVTAVAEGGVLSSGITNSNPAALNLLAGSGAAPLLALGFYSVWGGATINPVTFTIGGSDAKDGTQTRNNWENVTVAWKFVSSSPTTIVVDMDDEGNRNLVGCAYLELTI